MKPTKIRKPKTLTRLQKIAKSTQAGSETITEGLFREFHGSTTFIEKSAIPKSCGFKSKKGTESDGYPDFYLDTKNFAVIVEAKAINQKAAEKDLRTYMKYNDINKDIIGIALSGQSSQELQVTYFYRDIAQIEQVKKLDLENKLVSIDSLTKNYEKRKWGDTVSEDELKSILKKLNEIFHNRNKVRDTDRSLLFAGLMIALTNDNFRATYKNIQAPTITSGPTTKGVILEAHNLNTAIVSAIEEQIQNKINNFSKQFSWKEKFSFVKTIDFTLEEYKTIIRLIEEKILVPFQNGEKQDILGKAYKIFLQRAGKVDSKNIILTPDHIKVLMVKLARLTKNDILLDTCTGSGGFLMEAMETMIRLAGDDETKILEIKESQLIGFEIDPVLFALACSNMFLHGDGRTNLLFRNSLLSGKNQKGIVTNNDGDLLTFIRKFKPTKCIINPPYEKNNSILFVKQALDYLEENGKLITIMPKPTLTHNGEKLTKEILKIAKLDFVIKMPTRLFAEQKRTVNTAIFGFTKTPHQKTDEVLFYDLEDDGHTSIQHKGRVDKDGKWANIEKTLIDAISNSREIPDVSEKRKIYEGNVLNCAGFIKRSTKNSSIVQVKDLFNIQKGSLASEEAKEGEYDFITASEDWKKHENFSHDCEALVYAVAASGSLGRSHYVKGKFIASNLCLILTVKKSSGKSINMEFYNAYFNSIRKRIVADLADGTSKLTISKDDFANYYISYVPISEQNEFVSKYLKKLTILREQILRENAAIAHNIKNFL